MHKEFLTHLGRGTWYNQSWKNLKWACVLLLGAQMKTAKCPRTKDRITNRLLLPRILPTVKTGVTRTGCKIYSPVVPPFSSDTLLRFSPRNPKGESNRCMLSSTATQPWPRRWPGDGPSRERETGQRHMWETTHGAWFQKAP